MGLKPEIEWNRFNPLDKSNGKKIALWKFEKSRQIIPCEG